MVKITAENRRVGDGTPGPGRPKGVANKTNALIRDMIVEALDRAGGADYLHEQAITNPNAFLTLIGKVLPMQLTGADGGPLQATLVAKVERVLVDPKPQN